MAGQRRFYAVQYAGFSEIKATLYENLSTEEVSKIQLTENTKKPIGSIGRAESIPRTRQRIEKIEGKKLSNNSFAEMINVPPTIVKEAYYFDNLLPEILDQLHG